MTNLSDLIAQREALDTQIKTLSQTQRTEAIEQVRALMHDHGVTLADLKTGTRGPGKLKTGEPKKVPAKYRDAAGNSWSGRGLKPKWLQAAIASGKKAEDFAI